MILHFTIINEHLTIINEHFTSISLKYTIISSFDYHWEAAPTELLLWLRFLILQLMLKVIVAVKSSWCWKIGFESLIIDYMYL